MVHHELKKNNNDTQQSFCLTVTNTLLYATYLVVINVINVANKMKQAIFKKRSHKLPKPLLMNTLR